MTEVPRRNNKGGFDAIITALISKTHKRKKRKEKGERKEKSIIYETKVVDWVWRKRTRKVQENEDKYR